MAGKADRTENVEIENACLKAELERMKREKVL